MNYEPQIEVIEKPQFTEMSLLSLNAKDIKIEKLIAELSNIHEEIKRKFNNQPTTQKEYRAVCCCASSFLVMIGGCMFGITLLAPQTEFTKTHPLFTSGLYQNRSCYDALRPYMRNSEDDLCSMGYTKEDDFYNIWEMCNTLVKSYCSTSLANSGLIVVCVAMGVLVGMACILIFAKRSFDKRRLIENYEKPLPAAWLDNKTLFFLNSQKVDMSRMTGSVVLSNIENRIKALHIMKLTPLLFELGELVVGYLDKPNASALEITTVLEDEANDHVMAVRP